MDISTIIVSYNTFDLTRQAVESALQSASGLSAEIIVVDNASPDASGERLARHFTPLQDAVKILQNSENTGFSKASNQGYRVSCGDVLFFLNPDTIVHDDAIRRVHQVVAGGDHLGAVGPIVLNADGSIQPSTGSFPSLRHLIRHYLPLFGRPDDSARRGAEVDVVHGCALAVRRDHFEQVGGWNEDYFMYAEERELCLALATAGYTNYYLAEAQITHFGGASTADRHADYQIMQQRSALAYLRRHHGRWLVAANRVLGFLGFYGRDLIFGLRERVGKATAPGLSRRREAAAALWRWFLFDYR